MAVVHLEKIRVFTPSAEASVLVDLLQNAGCVEIITEGVTAPTDTPTANHALQLHNQHTKIEMARAFFAPYQYTDFLRNALEGGRAYTSDAELTTLAQTTDATAIITQVEEFQFRLAELDRTERSLQDQAHTLHAWERLSLPLNTITETKTTKTYALRAPERLLKKSIDEIIAATDSLVSIELVSNTTALITFFKSIQPIVEELISTGGLEVVQLPHSTNSAAQEIDRIATEQSALKTARAVLQSEITTAAATYLPLLQKLSDLSRWEAEQASTVHNLARTGRTSMVTAWAPKLQLPELEHLFVAKLSAYAVEILPQNEAEAVPTKIQNDGVVEPFESVTNLYGAPYHKDLDPTPVLSVFFFIFFGICLSDAGYGLILMALTGFVLAKYHLQTGMRQLITLLFFGGVSTFFAGILFGGYLGINLQNLIASYPQLSFLGSLQQFDPISNPLPVFYLALVLGFIHVAFGLCLNMYRKYTLNETKDAILDEGPWLLMFTLIALYIANMVGLLNPALGNLLSSNTTIIFGVAAGLIVITQGRSQKNPIMMVLYGLLGLYGGVGYFADILSYSRLMALGLATGALGVSINSIATFVGGDSLGIGTIFMIVILVLGHTLNIAISLMGTFINSARLQFVEFFSKFSTGTGRPFMPFRKEPRHVIILPDPPSPSP